MGSEGHEEAKRYLLTRMKEVGLEPYSGGSFELPYRPSDPMFSKLAEQEAFTNLVGVIPGSDPQLEPLLLGAHYDTAGIQPGADDNAAAVAILLALTLELRGLRLERPVIIAFFDAEEPPFFHSSAMGSTVFYEEQRLGGVHAAVILDLVGHEVPLPGLGNLLFITGMESNEELAGILTSQPAAGLRILPTLNRYVGDMSDHHVFRLHERPYLFLSCGRWRHYHARSDTPGRLAYRKMRAITTYLRHLTPTVCEASLSGVFEGYDSTPQELRFLREAIGPLAASLGLSLENRGDIDRLVATFMGKFGV